MVSPKIWTIFFMISALYYVGQKPFNFCSTIFGETITGWIHSEIYWPLRKSINVALFGQTPLWYTSPRTTDAQRGSSLQCTPTPKYLGTAEAYFFWHINPIFQISLIYAFIGVHDRFDWIFCTRIYVEKS